MATCRASLRHCQRQRGNGPKRPLRTALFARLLPLAVALLVAAAYQVECRRMLQQQQQQQQPSGSTTATSLAESASLAAAGALFSAAAPAPPQALDPGAAARTDNTTEGTQLPTPPPEQAQEQQQQHQGQQPGAAPPPPANPPVTAYDMRIDDMGGLVLPKGYQLQEHLVITSDGYKLRTFRIPQGRAAAPAFARGRRPAVLLVHGISLCSTCWVVNKAEQSLAFILADQGYDVWMMNTRGNTFGREHTYLNDRMSAFWRFSMDEMALKDLPETIEYIQDNAGVQKVALVTHSQGGSLAYMALADDPSLADSVSAAVAMAPCAYVKYLASPVMKTFLREANDTTFLNRLPPQEFTYMSETTQATMLDGTCQIPLSMPGCLTYMEGIFGPSNRITSAQYRRYWQIWPSSTSLANTLQWAQIYNEPREAFFRYNYGPEYDLTRIRVPIVLFSGGQDMLATAQDVAAQVDRLKQAKALAGQHFTKAYSHMDYIWDTGANREVYPRVVAALMQLHPLGGGN